MRARYLPVCALLLFVTVPPADAQSIAGTVVWSGDPARSYGVSFLDAQNALPAAAAPTDFEGRFDSGPLPVGNYRVRVTPPAFSFDIRPDAPSQFFGAGGLDRFCQASVVPVQPSMTSILDIELGAGSPPLFKSQWFVEGQVVNAASAAPLAGILVQVFDADRAQIVATAVTDADGHYQAFAGLKDFKKILEDFVENAVRIRFSDPANNYLPQFYGADADVFCSATALDRDAEGPVNVAMRPLTPGHVTEELLDTVDDLGLPPAVETSLAAPLVRAADLLTDANPTNDAASCGQLTAFLSRIDVDERKRNLSPEEADRLRSAAEYLRALLGCR